MRGLTQPFPTARLLVFLALLSYGPTLATQPGVVGADTKTYLYLDPGLLVSRAPFLWTPSIGLGTVTHQTIGYLWPMGPWYLLFEVLGTPDWVAQRLWTGSLLFAAGAGCVWLHRELGRRDAGVAVASLFYMLSPYFLHYEARISVILLPWVALPWLVAFTARAVATGGWRWPAAFALTVLTVGSINATALVLIAPGPLMWCLHELLLRQSPRKRVLGALVRIALLTIGVSLWWMAGLWAQGRFGLPVLRYTESYKTVADASTAHELLRGLGYWFFYGRDKLSPWIEPAIEYTNRTVLLALSYALPTLALLGAAFSRWRHRAYFLSVAAVGGVIAVGAHPWDRPSPYGVLWKAFASTDTGLALRSTPRALPLVVLGLSALAGSAVGALQGWRPRLASPAVFLSGVLLAANLPPLWNGTLVAANLRRPEEIPHWWSQAADRLDEGPADERVLEIPGADFAAYRWGNTVDPITPGLIRRPYFARELFPYGSPQTVALAIAFDRLLQEHLVEPDTVAPVARLMSAGDIVFRGDLQYERYRLARPSPTWKALSKADGLDGPELFGVSFVNRAGPEHPMLDELELALDPRAPSPPAVARFSVSDPLPILRAEPASGHVVVAGDPEALVDLAEVGLLSPGRPYLFAATLRQDGRLAGTVMRDATVVVTDTNRKRARRWGTLQQTTGYTERADERPAEDPTDNRLEIFPSDVGVDSMTVTEQRKGPVATASEYGNPVTYTPDDRPWLAVDGDVRTAWRVGAFSDVRGESITLELPEPITSTAVTLVQPTRGVVNRYITRVRMHFEGGDAGPQSSLDATLTDASRGTDGQTVRFAPRRFRRLRIEILDTDAGVRRRYDALSGVGFAEVQIHGASGPTQELVRPPRDHVTHLARDVRRRPLVFVFTRERSDRHERVRSDEERRIVRVVEVGEDRSFELRAEARLSPMAPEEVLRDVMGGRRGGPRARADARLPGAPHRSAHAAFDGRSDTWWSPPFEEQAGHWLEVELPAPQTVRTLRLTFVADGRHSLPQRLFLQVDGADDVKTLQLPVVEPILGRGATVTVRVDIPPTTGRRFRLAIDDVRDVETVDWHSSVDIVTPVAIAEAEIGDAKVSPLPERFDTGCRDDLLKIDGRPVPLKIHGHTLDALEGEPLTVEPCDREIRLRAGRHVLETSLGEDVGFDIDAVVLSSGEDGRPRSPEDLLGHGSEDVRKPRVLSMGPVRIEAEFPRSSRPFWLVLGQSLNDGWNLRVDGEDMGPPTLVDGFANGWLIDPDRFEGDLQVVLEWWPQRVVNVSMALSAVAALLCVLLLLRPRSAPPPPAVAQPLADLFGPRPPLSRRAGIALAISALVVAVLVMPPPAPLAVLVALCTFVAARARRAGQLPLVTAGVIYATVGVYVVLRQYLIRFPPDFAWPRDFDAAHPFGMAVLCLLGVQAVVDVLRERRDAA
ncbi:MAG: coagulation factor 5/8 type [Acidimicrobiales bacterium]|nr:MAG: coagulation factor 5/8 type [Acidimicrobiales bacterium]